MKFNLPLRVQQAIDEAERDWNEHSAPQLRMFSLQRLARFLHAEKSRILANPEAGYGPAVDQLEDKLDWIREQGDCHHADLGALLLEAPVSPPAPPAREFSLPKDLDPKITAKFAQYDRRWQLASLSFALQLGWSLVEIDCWAEVPKIDQWGESLRRAFWPRAIPLLAESLAFSEQGHFWQGKWTLVAEPNFYPELLSRIPLVAAAPSPPRSALLFPL